MERRWIIHNLRVGAEWNAKVSGPFAGTPFPVVPCDDAAIERVAQKIVERTLGGFDDGDGAAWAALKEPQREEWREEARELLSAAGEPQ